MSRATELADKHKGRADDCGELARAVLADRERQAGEAVAWATFKQVTVALSGLLEQVEKFASEHGEADFETAEALHAIEAAIAFDDRMPASLPAPQAVQADMMLVPAEIVNRFPEINPSNYDHDDACALNAWGVELVLAAAPSPDGKAEQAEAPSDDWYCEEHPEQLMGHGGCAGAGIPECARVSVIANQLRLARQEIRETARHRDDLVAQFRAREIALRVSVEDASDEYARYVVEDTAPRTLNVHMLAAFDAALGGKS